VLKLLRRLEPGPHPEIEILRFLSGRGFARIPPLIAGLDYQPRDAEVTSLAVLQAFVPNQGTGWERAVGDVRRFLLHDTPPAPVTDGTFLEAGALLGQRTAELHVALASDAEDPAFAPEPMTAAHAAQLAAALERDAARALALLAGRVESLTPPARQYARAVLDAGARLDTRIRSFATAPAGGSMRTRVHGDYHLGQVLATGDDFVIIDFEGEPNRSLAERRAKQSPLKDVAGMLRSFSYAAHATLPAASESRPDPVDGLETRAQTWVAAVTAAFLSSYRRTVAEARLLPADDQSFASWLDAFLLQKAIYELEYELASRPGWASLPLLGLLQILQESPPTRSG
jgi:maltose alpha-D-glucosyltransferase/alpha-amylase